MTQLRPLVEQAKATATSLASEANEKAKGVLNGQIAAGAEWVGYVAEATKAAADSLDRNAPKLSGLVRETAQKVERFSRDVKDQSVEELYQSASDFTRRQPALVFGSAAVFGFFLFRLLKTDPTSASAAGRESGRFLQRQRSIMLDDLRNSAFSRTLSEFLADLTRSRTEGDSARSSRSVGEDRRPLCKR